MALKLGKSFNREYTMRFPFLDGYYDISMFFNRKSTFLLFNVDSGIQESKTHGVSVKMFKNLESSTFCETFLELHNFRKNTLDIINQYKNVKPEFFHEISFVTNETLTLAKIETDDGRELYDSLNIYGFTLNSYMNEFLFLITERHNIIKKLNKKIVRTSGIQIATSSAIKMLNEYHNDSKNFGSCGLEKPLINVNDKIRLD